MNGVVVYSNRDHLVRVLSTIFESFAISNVEVSSDPDDVGQILERHPRHFLVIDNEAGSASDDVYDLLERTVESHKIETRPILMIADAVDQSTAAICYEFGIKSVHEGSVAEDELKTCIAQIIDEEESDAAIRDVLVRVGTLRANGELDKAIEVLDEFCQKVPNHVRLVTELAEVYIAKKDWAKASQLLKEVDVFEPPYVKGMHALARCLMRQGRYEVAGEIYQKVQPLNPTHVDRIVEMGRAFFLQGKLDAAQDSFMQAKELKPKHRGANLGEGQVLLMRGELNAALQLLKHFTSDRELASLFNSTAIMAVRTGNFDKGIELYDQALARVTIPDTEVEAKLVFNKGVGFKKWSKPKEAQECFDRACKLDENFEKAKKHHQLISEHLERDDSSSIGSTDVEKNPNAGGIDDIFEPVRSSEETSESKLGSDGKGTESDDDFGFI